MTAAGVPPELEPYLAELVGRLATVVDLDDARGRRIWRETGEWVSKRRAAELEARS